MATYPLPQETEPWIRTDDEGRGKPRRPFLQFMAQLGRISDFSFSLLWSTTLAQWQSILGIPVYQTGDARLTLASTAPAGWILHNEGSIGDGSSNATTRANADTQNLFNLLFAAPFNDTTAPIQLSTGAATTRAAQGSAAAAFANHCRILVPRQFGRAIGIAGTGIGLTNRPLGSWDGAETNSFFDTVSHTHGVAPFYFMCTDTTTSTFNSPGPIAFYNTSAAIFATGAAGSSSAFNIVSPRTYWNILIKL